MILHHANRSPSAIDRELFYQTKKQILDRYGKLTGYDIQSIPGKKCNSCGGTGIHNKWGFHSDGEPYIYERDTCWFCDWGWYRTPQYNVLKRRKLGRYTFHTPIKRFIKHETAKAYIGRHRPNDQVREFLGYIDHKPANRYWLNIFWIITHPRRWASHHRSTFGTYYCHRPYNDLMRFLNNVVGFFRKKWIRQQVIESIFGRKRKPVKPPDPIAYNYGSFYGNPAFVRCPMNFATGFREALDRGEWDFSSEFYKPLPF